MVVGCRAALILAVDALLLTDDLPPRVEMYVPVLDAELAAVGWTLLGQLSRDLALQIEQIEEDWRVSKAEQAEELVSDESEGRVPIKD